MIRKILASLVAIILLLNIAVCPVKAENLDEDPQTYVWIQEGDSVFCYVNNGGWSEAEMLIGWHTIDEETYYFYEQEMDEFRYGEMARGEVWIGAYTCYFDEEGHFQYLEIGVE